MRANPKSIRFSDALKVATYFFNEPRISGSHHVFKMPWPQDPRVNLQDDGGNAQPYQVKQLVAAVDKLRSKAGE